MKILLISEFFPTSSHGDFTGGVEARTYYVARELAKRHEVTVLSSWIHGSQRHSQLDGINVLRVGYLSDYQSPIDRLVYLIAAFKKALNIEADIIEGTNSNNQIIGYWLSKIKKIPMIAWTPDVWQGQWLKNMGIFGLVGSVIEHYNLSHRDIQYVAISNTVAKKMIKNKVPKSQIKVIPCGIDLQYIQKIKTIKKKTRTICLVSRLVGYKNIDVLLNAFSQINVPFPIELQIIGQGPQLNNLKELVRNLNIAKQVKFLGFKARYREVITEIKSSYIFCFPSTTEGFGIAMMESLASGVPAVVADLPLNHELTGGKGVLFFEPQNPNDLAEKLTKLLTDKKLYNKLQAQSEKVAKKYDWKEICFKTEQLYARLSNN